MFAKLKNAVAEKKAEYAEKKQNKWLTEVNPTGNEFLGLQGWKDVYEPTKVGKEKGDSSSGPNALQQKAIDSMSVRITAKIMKAMTEVVARPMDVAAAQLKGVPATASLGKLLNLLEAVLLTYRFSYKDAKQFAWVRSAVVDSLAVVLVELVDAEAKGLGKDPANLSPEDAQIIVNVIVAKVNNELTSRSAQMAEALKSSPLFAAAGEAQAVAASQVGAGGAVGAAAGAVANVNLDVDAGISMLLEFLRTMVTAKLDTVTVEISAVLGTLTAIAVKYRSSVLAAAVTSVSSGGDPDAMPADYQSGVKKELLEAIEGKYAEMEAKVTAFVRGLLKLAEDDE